MLFCVNSVLISACLCVLLIVFSVVMLGCLFAVGCLLSFALLFCGWVYCWVFVLFWWFACCWFDRLLVWFVLVVVVLRLIVEWFCLV